MIVSVVGLGYIGLPTAALLAGAGHDVIGFDLNAALREDLRGLRIATCESEVRQLVDRALRSGKLRVADEIPQAQAYIICVPTPTVNAQPVLTYVEEAAAAVAAVAPAGAMVVLESTVPPGTTSRIIDAALLAAGKDPSDFHIAHCPERVLPGAIVQELRGNARVIGGRTLEDAKMVKELYASFCKGDIALTSILVAEFVKVVENTYRDVNIAFANELAVFAEELGVDVWETIALANRHPRVDILSPGPGVGGHCIPVDPHFLSNANPLVTELIQSARRVNERMPYRVVRRITGLLAGTGGKIALLGAAYKADVDDARESVAHRIDALLREQGYTTAIFDPLVRSFDGPLCASLEDAVNGASAIVLVTNHRRFATIDPQSVAPLMRSRLLIDTRNFFDHEAWRDCGFLCYVLGQPVKPRTAAAVLA